MSEAFNESIRCIQEMLDHSKKDDKDDRDSIVIIGCDMKQAAVSIQLRSTPMEHCVLAGCALAAAQEFADKIIADFPKELQKRARELVMRSYAQQVQYLKAMEESPIKLDSSFKNIPPVTGLN